MFGALASLPTFQQHIYLLHHVVLCLKESKFSSTTKITCSLMLLICQKMVLQATFTFILMLIDNAHYVHPPLKIVGLQ